MSTQTGHCPNCRMINSYTATHCLECGSQLPWANAVLQARQQAQAAAQAAQSQQAQTQKIAQTQQAAQAQRATAYSQQAAGQYSTPGVTPVAGDEVNVYEVYGNTFIGKSATALSSMDATSALVVGLICALVFSLCMAGGTYLWVQKIQAIFAPFANLSMPGSSSPGSYFPTPNLSTTPTSTPSGPSLGAGQLFKLLIVSVTPLVTIALSSALCRKVFGTGDDGAFGGDVFIAGVSLLPVGFWALASGFLGFGNSEVTIALGVFALCYTIVLLYNGCTLVSRIREAAAAFSVPLILLLSAWLTKIVLVQLVNIP